MTTEQMVGLVIAGIVAGGGIVGLFPKARSEWFSGTRSLVDLQAKTIEALEAKVEELTHELRELRDHLVALEKSYVASRVCSRAVDCENYVPPTRGEERL